MTKWLVTAGVLVGMMFAAQPAQAQVQFGVQANYADDFDFGVGARAQFGLGSMLELEEPLNGIIGVVSLDYYFPDCDPIDCSYIEINANGLYPIPLEDQAFTPYVGAGLHVGVVSIDYDSDLIENDSDTEVGLNALGGVNFDLGGLAAFAEGKIELGGAEQFVLRFGILFGGS